MQPKATLKFPAGEVSLEEKEEEEVKKMLSINGILQHQILNGVFSAQFRDDDLKLRYLYKVVFCLHYFSSILLFFYSFIFILITRFLLWLICDQIVVLKIKNYGMAWTE